MMLDVSALSVSPTCTVPVIVGAPPGAWLTPVLQKTPTASAAWQLWKSTLNTQSISLLSEPVHATSSIRKSSLELPNLSNTSTNPA